MTGSLTIFTIKPLQAIYLSTEKPSKRAGYFRHAKVTEPWDWHAQCAPIHKLLWYLGALVQNNIPVQLHKFAILDLIDGQRHARGVSALIKTYFAYWRIHIVFTQRLVQKLCIC